MVSSKHETSGTGADSSAPPGAPQRFGRISSLETRGTVNSNSASSKEVPPLSGEKSAAAAATRQYARMSSFESKDSRESIGWLANVVDDGLRDKNPEQSRGETKAALADAASLGVSDESDDAGDDGKNVNVDSTQVAVAVAGGAYPGSSQQQQRRRRREDEEAARDNEALADAPTEDAAGDKDGAGRSTARKWRRKRSITLDAAIDAQNHKSVLYKSKSYEAKLANNKLNVLYEKNDSFFDIVGRRIPCVIDAWSRRLGAVAPSSLIQVWANEFCGSDNPGSWSEATEPNFRCDNYHFKCIVQKTSFREEEEERLKRFREMSAQRVLHLSEHKNGFAGSLPGRVLMKNCAEWTPNCQLYTRSEFMRRDDAIKCGIGSILALPVHEIGKPHQPVCVVEIVRLGTTQPASAAAMINSAMENVSIAQDVEFLNSILKPLGLSAPALPQDVFGFSFEKLCPPVDSAVGGATGLSLVATNAAACPLTSTAIRDDERAVMEKIVEKAVEKGEVELAQFWYFIGKRKGSLVTNGLPHATNEDTSPQQKQGEQGAVDDEEQRSLTWFSEEQNANTSELGLDPFSRLMAYRIACEECALPLSTGGPVAAAFNAYKTTAKSKIIYWPDVQNATASKFVMSHTAASLKVEAVAAVVVPNILIDADGDRHNACAVLELVLPTEKTRDQHRKSISNVVNMAHSEGKQMQLSWKQQQSKEDDQTRSVDGDELR